MSMDPDISLNDQQKKLIAKLFECSTCNKCIFARPDDICEELGLSRQEVDEAIQFFMEKRLVRQMTIDGEVAITQMGIKLVEPLCACK